MENELAFLLKGTENRGGDMAEILFSPSLNFSATQFPLRAEGSARRKRNKRVDVIERWRMNEKKKGILWVLGRFNVQYVK